MRRAARATLRVAATNSLVPFLARAVQDFAATRDDLVVQIVASEQAAALGRRDADVALRFRRPDHPDLVVKRLGTVPFGLFDAPNRTGDWRERDYVEASGVLARAPMFQWFSTQVDPWRLRGRGESVETLRELAAAGVGMALLPLVTTVGDTRIAQIPCEPPPAPELFLAYHHALRSSPAVRAFLDHLVAAFERHPLIDV